MSDTVEDATVHALAERLNAVPEQMPAGRELDALVSLVVFGEPTHVNHEGTLWEDGPRGIIVPWYSQSIRDAWLVVEYMREQGINMQMEMLDPLTEQFDCYTVEVGPWSLNVEGVPDGPRAVVQADTAPLVICRAAILACRSAADPAQQQPRRGSGEG